MMNTSENRIGFVEDLRRNGARTACLGTPEGCNDPVIGHILSGWRYDLSSVSPVVRGDYETHLEGCQHCRARQRLHRTVDVVLMATFTVSFFAFLLATAITHRLPWGQTSLASLHTRHITFAVTLQTVALGGLLFSLLMWILVAIATPIPALFQATLQHRSIGARHRM